ncbi:hypothetical protein PCL_00650 [Purpureocillium lilacinum]|uniref:Uncharacterized protein n=1 Tax=Purpureocillium lilacinum TaxID=33203 RepID=A0A2U3E5E8_PURLI|nr:hypothetical protein Purlil1_10930 [Purpureocillium lilacinum]PWI69738.1 hypothetical protein PCL_00650 [Purpureocillium lilacinum]
MPRAASTSSVRREHARSGRVQRSTANPRCPPQCSVRPTRKPRYVTIATRRSDAGGQKTQQQRKAQVTSGKSCFARLPFIMIDLIVGVMAEPHVAGGKGPPLRADDLDGGSTAMRLRRRYWLGWAGERARVTGKAAKARQGTCAGGDFLPPACSPHCANRARSAPRVPRACGCSAACGCGDDFPLWAWRTNGHRLFARHLRIAGSNLWGLERPREIGGPRKRPRAQRDIFSCVGKERARRSLGLPIACALLVEPADGTSAMAGVRCDRTGTPGISTSIRRHPPRCCSAPPCHPSPPPAISEDPDIQRAA